MNLTISALTHFNAMKVLLLTLLIMSGIASANAAALTSTVNRNTMSTNETLTLTITSDQQVASSALDLSALRKDFEILSVSPLNSSSVSTINGQTQRISNTQWTINLAAKREGELQIPSFSIGQSRSRAISIKALKPEDFNNNNATQDAPLIAIGLADKISIYPGQQLLYTIELSAAGNVRDLSGNALEVPGATTEVIDQQQFQRIENGLSRTIVILKYAIFPQESGQITIPSLTFAGLIGGQRRFFGNQGQKVVGRTKALNIDVKPKPINQSSAWFPAENVSIRSSWSADVGALKTGSPITRTITITAQGQLANAIPPLEAISTNQASIKAYKDKPQLNSKKSVNGFTSTRIESEAVVVNTAGQVELPAVTVDWFNVNTQTWQQAVLEPERLTVSGKPVNNNAPISTSADIIEPSATTSTAAASSRSKTHWAWPLATTLLTLLCLLQSYLLFRAKVPAKQDSNNKTDITSESECWKQLSADIKGNNVTQIRQSIINWARAAHPTQQPMSLARLCQQVDAPLASLFNQIEASLFANDGAINLDRIKVDLKQELATYRKQLFMQKSAGIKTQHKNSLAPLYSNQ